jgi:hypothetical protein
MNGLPRTYFPPLSGTHTRFAFFAATAFALLYTETGAYSVRMVGTNHPDETAALLAVAFLVVFGGFLGSMSLPVRRHLFPEGDFTDATPALHSLSDQALMGSIIFTVASAVSLGIYLFLVWPNLVAVYNLVKDLFIYTVVGVVYYQGLVAFVRYLNFLYREKMDNATKVMAFEVGLILLTLALGLYLLTLDVLSLARTADPTGLIGLHIAVRDIWMTIIILVAYGWHLKRVADH